MLYNPQFKCIHLVGMLDKTQHQKHHILKMGINAKPKLAKDNVT